MDTLGRVSRWTNEPIIGANNKPRRAVLTERDINILFPLLVRFRYLPADFIHVFMGGDYNSLVRHLGLLARKPNLYLNRPEQQREHAEALYRKGIFEIADRGIQFLRDQGYEVPKRRYQHNFAHELMTCQIAASIDLGVKASPHTLIPWAEIAAHDSFPQETLKSSNPLSIPLGNNEWVTPDWEPFVIAYDNDEYRFFPGIEADMGTEPIDTSNKGRSSIRLKYRSYLTVLERRLYRNHYGASTFTVPIITNNPHRMQSMMDLLDRMQPGQFAEHFIFKHVPSFYAFRDQMKAGGQMFTEPWKRACGLPDFHMDQP